MICKVFYFIYLFFYFILLFIFLLLTFQYPVICRQNINSYFILFLSVHEIKWRFFWFTLDLTESVLNYLEDIKVAFVK
jgi:hypothetical protein